MKLYTIGFNGKEASQFFPLIKQNGIKRIIDVRLKNSKPMSTYTMKRDFPYFLSLFGIEYLHYIDGAPDEQLFDDWKDKKISWEEYTDRYLSIISERGISLEIKDHDCLLCSELVPDNCHRRLLAEILQDYKSGLEVEHL